MRLAILSDIHDHVWNLAAALHSMQDADALICCGDLCSPFVVDQLAEHLSRPMHIVFGNNDGDLYRITSKTQLHQHVSLYGHFFAGDFGDKHIAVNHYPDIAQAIAASGRYDVVCYGHNHTYQVGQAGMTLLINPGTIMGYDPINKHDVAATWVVYDTATGETTKHQV